MLTPQAVWKCRVAAYCPCHMLTHNITLYPTLHCTAWPCAAFACTAIRHHPVPKRIAACKAKGFPAIDPDNTDGYLVNTGFPLTPTDALNFLNFLSTEARAQGLAIGLKNTLELIDGNVGLWDFAINEQCYENDECSYYAPFKSGAWVMWDGVSRMADSSIASCIQLISGRVSPSVTRPLKASHST